MPSATCISVMRTARTHVGDYVQLIKLRLSLLVVFSASMAYLWSCNRIVDTATIWLLSIGGFLITGSANIINQVIERRSDALMKRTAQRPLPCNRVGAKEAIILSLIIGMAGSVFLFMIDMLCGWMGILALLLYAFTYTPLKKISPVAVVPGAIAGSLPVVIGCVAAQHSVTINAILLFMIQFIWQFPHTWSIAWLLNDEYRKAGINMLPGKRKNKASAILIFISSFLTIPAAYLLYMYESVGIGVTWLLCLAGTLLLILAFRLFLRTTDRSAVLLMISCFFYLPLILISLVIEKFL